MNDNLNYDYLIELMKEKKIQINYKGDLLNGDVTNKVQLFYDQITSELERTKNVYLPALEQVNLKIKNRYNEIVQHMVEDDIVFNFTTIDPFVKYLIENDYLDENPIKPLGFLSLGKIPFQNTDELIQLYKQTVNYTYREMIDDVLIANTMNYQDLWDLTLSDVNKNKKNIFSLNNSSLNLLYIITKALLSKYHDIGNPKISRDLTNIIDSLNYIYKVRVDNQYKIDHSPFVNLKTATINNRPTVNISIKAYEKFIDNGGNLEILKGAIIAKDTFSAFTDLVKKKDYYIELHNSKTELSRMALQQSNISNLKTIYKEEINHLLKRFENLEEGVLKQINIYLNKSTTLLDISKTTTTLVLDYVLRHTNARLIYDNMIELSSLYPKLTGGELPIFTVTELFLKYIFKDVTNDRF